MPSPSVPPSGGAATSAVRDALQGTWELLSFETHPPEGVPQHKRVSGRLTFDQFSNIAVRAELDPAEPGVTPPRTVFLDFRAKASISPDRTVSFVGIEQLTPPDRMAPEAVDPTEWRRLDVTGDTARLSIVDAGGRRIGTLTFRRVG